MTSSRGDRYPYFLFLFLISVPSAFGEELSGPASASSTIITIGVGLFGLLFAYVAYLTVRFLLKTFGEFRQSRKQTEAHGEAKHLPAGEAALNLAFWFWALFATAAVGLLFIALLLANADIDMSSTKTVGAMVVTLVVSAFSLR